MRKENIEMVSLITVGLALATVGVLDRHHINKIKQKGVR